ncbi:MAG: ABC transporter substrate-binding protein [Acidimicrobiaceae bacterium]|nr:ABC transporter substrate-binding protein [Acidimicrobiaceae bacterium]MXY12201.1 ABC transporter substrate-binding protein [Acidimicrobiaceae bacterium]MXZ63940.1 ABC transporter substrate-binding protein [Acidimicrobiaceae bacterium]MYF33457.1 ABC transporter substrate-binding protein [Acidimicrobiaceae bacterium]MYG79182.1 ABC transporter substrate-binding protein [Acidimicrobiaceae bacterium]
MSDSEQNSEQKGIVRRTLSRRRFNMIAGGSVLLAACGDDGETAQPAATTTAAPATTTEAAPATTTPATTTTIAATTTTEAGATTTTAAPRPLKTLRYGYHAAATSADTLDPAYRTSSTDGLFQGLVSEQIVRLDENLTPTPHLAERWEANADGTEWTFHLRDGITFHDGKPFVAADVVYTFQRLLDPDVASPGAGGLPGLEPDGITAPDDRTVVMRLTQPNVDWPEAITNSHTRIVPEGATNADLAAQSLGTGAYRIDEFIPGEISTVFERNENYWQPDLPKVDFFEVITIPEVEAQLAAIRGGQIDILSRAPAAQLDALDAEPDIMVISNPVGSSSVAYCQIDVPPFDNNDLRLAIKYATNRPQHNDLVYGGRAYQMNDIPLPGLIRFGLAGSREHNLAMAREHLSRAGYADGIDLTLTLASMEDWIEWTQVWQQQLAEAGINVELDVTPADTYWGDQWLSAPFAMTGWNVRTVDHGLGLWYHSEAEWNETHWADEQFDADLAAARSTTDEAERTRLYHKMQQQIIDEGGHFVPNMFPLSSAVRVGVTGWQPRGVYYTIDVP